jgi:type I restriction enzyme S subunit
MGAKMSEVRRGYKQTEVGVIPEDWAVGLLDSVAKRGSGHTPDKAHPEYWDGSIKWVSLQDSNHLDRLYIRDTAAKITPAGIANSSARMHPHGTVVLSRDAGVGKSAIMAEDMAVSQHFMAWTCGPQLCNVFLYYWLQSQKPEFERIAMGNTIKTIGLPYFRKLKTPIPSRAEQDSIAEALSDADALIESLDQLLTKKRQIKQGAMQELLTGKKRLPGFQSKPGYKQTEVGMIPEDWELASIGAVASVLTGNTPPTADPANYGDEFLFVSPVDMGYLKYIHRTEKMLSRKGFAISRHFPAGSVLFVCIGSTIGKCAIATIPLTSNQQINAVVPSQAIETDFLFYALCFIAAQIKALAGEQAVPIVNKTQFSEARIPLPILREQATISAILSDMDADISALETKLTKSRQLKQGMMQELLTGRTRLV